MGALCSSNNTGASDVPKNNNLEDCKVHKKTPLGEERKQELKAAFNKMDRNSDGNLSKQEMMAACNSDADPEVAKLLGLPESKAGKQILVR